MYFGLTIEKLLLIAVVAALIVGPDRLPRYTEALAQSTRRVRDWLGAARTRIKHEIGPEFEDDWRSLDPRQYDPRRIIREALLDDPSAGEIRAPKRADSRLPPVSPLATATEDLGSSSTLQG